jgi:hypothetical protein
VPPRFRHPEYFVQTQYRSPSGEPYYYFAHPVGPRGGGFGGPQGVGETWITRRQYLRMARGHSRERYALERAERARDAGFRPTNYARYWTEVDAYRAQQARTTGRIMGRAEASRDPEFRAIRATILQYRRQEDTEVRGPGGIRLTPGPDRSPHGPMAQALVKLGRRQPWWPWDVGDTPDAERSRRF